MKLEFSLLIVDDAPDNVEQAIHILGDHLHDKGFSLFREVAEDLSERGVQRLARAQGRNYDLVMVDYNLGQVDRNGALVAHQLRQELLYVDMVFYSSISISELLTHLAEHEVSGVFAERREDLGDALTGLADSVIGKAVDLNHMRGIAMAEVAEMDVLMGQALIKVFRSNNEQIDGARERTVGRLREGMDANAQRLQDHLNNGGLPAVVGDSLLFSLSSKFQAVRRVARCLEGELRDELEVVGSYNEDIIHNRNMLAHVREEMRDDGTTVLFSMGRNQREVVIDDAWMSDFRQKLHRHRAALVAICEALVRQFNGVDAANDAEQG